MVALRSSQYEIRNIRSLDLGTTKARYNTLVRYKVVGTKIPTDIPAPDSVLPFAPASRCRTHRLPARLALVPQAGATSVLMHGFGFLCSEMVGVGFVAASDSLAATSCCCVAALSIRHFV